MAFHLGGMGFEKAGFVGVVKVADDMGVCTCGNQLEGGCQGAVVVIARDDYAAGVFHCCALAGVLRGKVSSGNKVNALWVWVIHLFGGYQNNVPFYPFDVSEYQAQSFGGWYFHASP